MSRRIFLRTLLAIVVAVFGLLSLSANLYAQGPGDEAFDRVAEVQEIYTEALMADPAVVGTGIGLGGGARPVLLVLLEHGGVPGIPENLEGVPVRVMVTGKIYARGDTTAKYRPAPIGVSTGHPDITAGTIGCRVTDGTYVYALSNNHVYADENRATEGDNVLQPGPYDGGSNPDDSIGTLYDFEPILFDGSDNYIDAAIASTTTDSVDTATLADGYGVPQSTTIEPALRMPIQKYGRTTGLTTGKIDALNVTVNVNYESGVATFVGQIGIRGGNFSAGGDSGSLIVTDYPDDPPNDKRPVGLLFAGSQSTTIANPIDAVLGRFDVTVDGSTGGSTTDSPPSVSIANPEEGDTVSGTVSVTADASDDDAVTQVEFFVDGGSIGVDSDSSDGWSASWDTTGYADGSHTVSATATDTAGQTASDSISVTVDNEPSAGVTVDSITPNSMSAGSTTDVTISGSGFAAGADVTFENGSGPAPEASNVVVTDVDGDEVLDTITATVTAKSGGPPRKRVWDVRVTNPDGSTGVLDNGFTVTP